jgi:hypothetical protein
MFKSLKHAIILLSITGLSACTSASPTPDPNGPRLNGFDALPKAMATVGSLPTPNAPAIQATLGSQHPTETLAPPTFTPTPTANVGIFMGAGTFSAGNLFPTGTRAPLIITTTPQSGAPAANNSGSSGSKSCSVQPASEFANANKNAAVSQKLGCPTAPPVKVQLVVQSFQNGFMFWRNTKEIYVLSTAGLRNGAATDTFWRVVDAWTESLPASDPAQVPPAGLLQPVRGFGYVWRSNPNMRNSLGWALSAEQPYDATWQNFEHGWMMTGNNGAVFALAPLDGPPPTTGIHFGPLTK